ncbi:MAG: tRNA (adenosine(37)-N6)-threonylcarbamoyltransferase complex dimerization subunit type 1 TsaB [Bacteroidota bacterium]
MPRILCIETSTTVCSAAISENGTVSCCIEKNDGNSHSELLTVFIEELFRKTGLSADLIEAVAVSEGPGSYTGLRIGVSVAKGFCFRREIPLIAVSTLQSLAFGVKMMQEDENFADIYCPMIDAGRMEVFYTQYGNELNVLQPVKAEIISEGSFDGQLKKHRICFTGNAMNKIRSVIKSENAVFIDLLPSARYIAPLAFKKYKRNDFTDTAYFEPFYLKDFIAIPPKNKVIPG